MTPHAQHLADRLRAALSFHSGRPQHRRQSRDETPTPATARTPGEQFARRLREAIDA